MAGGSKAAVYSAIGANSFVMVAKFIGWAVSGSGTMLAEAIHSAADVGNQALLVVGMKRAATPPDAQHPYGYGRDAFVWSLMSAVGIFFVGCGVSVAHGVHTLLEGGNHEVGNPALNIGILALSMVAEGGSLYIAVRGLNKEAKARGIGFWQHVRTTDDPFGVAVLLEDSAACLGVLIAFCTIGLTALTHQSIWDAVGSILIGVLLGGVALFLMQRNRALLIGQAIRQDDLDKVVETLQNDPVVDNIASTRAVVAGASSYRISAEIDFDGREVVRRLLAARDEAELAEEIRTAADDPQTLQTWLEEFGEDVLERMGDEVDRIEAKLREAVPRAKAVELEPD
jgi:zinc transporter 9